MSSQNWCTGFREHFRKRRGYDPQPYYPAWMGFVVGDTGRTERFLFDMRRTAQELVIEEHAGAIKSIAHEHGLLYSNEPYDMNPAGNIDLGSIADIPMCEFWNNPLDTESSCIEAVSIANTMGRRIVKAEAFTNAGEGFERTPATMKNQTDWAFAMGVNGIVFHTYQHQALGSREKPGMTMGPYGTKFRILVLPNLPTMTPETLAVIDGLVKQGATVIGDPPERSPSLERDPACDRELAGLAMKMWQGSTPPGSIARIGRGQGAIYWGGDLAPGKALYPGYAATASLLESFGIAEDFSSPSGKLRFIHRRTPALDIYFVSNRTGESFETDGIFRVDGLLPQLWDPVTGEIRNPGRYESIAGRTRIPLIRHYSGTAIYRKSFDLDLPDPASCGNTRCWLDLGKVLDLCEVRLNGENLGILWTAPWRIDITDALVRQDNQLEIRVTNPWVNRLIGDLQPGYKDVRKVSWPCGLLGGKKYPAGRHTFATHNHYRADSPLQPSGLLGPVSIQRSGKP